ncbi:winged helix-turn-helix transcriptional regulator [Streptomyces sp. SID14478]|uniref:GntR family transcriptional regulator n=1 Tax=Streptomyces sp. SID14478 TaxID=2706073 RepID=UPI0013DF7C5E|nr:winged helix-turn-helix transcriptional regulator [Streptomyces sp. SID14478]
MTDNNSPAPGATSRSIADDLRERIRAGVLQPGVRLPTQAVLAQEFGVERGTVRQALQQLKNDGLLANLSKGSPPTVAEDAAPPPQASQSARSILGPHLVTAFGEQDVRLDVVSLTAETLVLSLGQPLSEVYERRLTPRSVYVRVMLPRADERLDYPSPEKGWGHDEELDDAIDQRNQLQGRSHRFILQQVLGKLRKDAGIDVRVEFRTLRGTPVRKVYLLNRKELLMGHYVPGRYERDVEGFRDPVCLRDVEGAETKMFVFGEDGGQGQALMDAEQLTFDRVWDFVAQPLD